MAWKQHRLGHKAARLARKRARRPPSSCRLGFETLEDRTLLTVAQDLVTLIAPYQQALNTALDAAASMPLAGEQLAGVSEFATIFQNSQSSIHSQTQSIVNNGHYQLIVPLPALAKTFTFDLGLDAFLQVNVAGGVHAAIQPTLNVGFDYQNGVVSLDVDETRLNIGFDLSLPNFTGQFSFNDLLFTRAVDAGTSFHGDLTFAFDAGGQLDPQFSGEAHVLLGLTMSFVDPALNASFNPTFRTTLDLDWGFGANNQLTAPSIQLQNFALEADSFLQGFLGDVVKTVQKFTRPIQPFIDFFQTPVPIISAFGSSETIGSLMLKGAGHAQEQQDRFTLMVQIIQAVNTIDLSAGAGGAVIPFGTITLTGNAQQAGAFGFDTSLVSDAIDDILNSPALQAVEDALMDVGRYSGLTSTAGFQFPLLEDPQSVLAGILLGQTKTMFSFSTGRQHFELAPSIGVGIKDLFGVFLEAGVIFDANLTMGYDTAGLIAVAQNPSDVSKLLHGFYFDNRIDAAAPPIPNHPPVRQTGLYLQGFMELSGSAIATLSGGLYANINVELVNTDSSPHVHLDTMLANLGGGGKVFDLSGKVYAAADISLTFPNPIGPDITLFSFNLAYDELLNFDPPPPPAFGVPVTVVDVIDQHTLLLDVNKMGVGSRIVTVQPFHNFSVNIAGNIVEADGIRVDYPNEIYLFVQRKNDTTTNYYNFVGLNGTAPDGVSINVIDPFRVFYDEGAVNPHPAQTKPGVLLAGGKNVVYKYKEFPDGTKPNVLLVGGYGSNTLGGGTMSFGNFIPGDRIAQAKAHFANTSGYDGAGQGLINSVIDAAIAPANPAGIIGATMTGSRGGLMFGGPGNNSFFAAGAGAYEMLGGNWVNSFNISPSFNGAPATYLVDGGSGGDSKLIVRVPADEHVVFENSTIVDKYTPTLKALAAQANAGLSATAHGIQKVHIVASPGASVEIGDTSEVDIDFSIQGGANLRFGGTSAPDQFNIDIAAPDFRAKKNHRAASTYMPFDDTTTYVPAPGGQIFSDLLYPDPVFYIHRIFGTNGREQTIPFQIHDADSSSLVLDGKGASDTYDVDVGLGSFIDVSVDDSDSTTQNALTVNFNSSGFTVIPSKVVLTDSQVQFEYYTSIQLLGFLYSRNGGVTWSSLISGMAGEISRAYYMSSVSYSPTVTFGANTDVTLSSNTDGTLASPFFARTVINRPVAPQNAKVVFTGPGGEMGTRLAFDLDSPNPSLLVFQGSGLMDIEANGGNLAIELHQSLGGAQIPINIHSNAGTLSFSDYQVWSGGYPTYNILSNTGVLNINEFVVGSLGVGGYVQGLTHVVNVRANAGTINLHDVFHPAITPYGIDAQLNVGDNGSLANVHGAINLSSAVVNLLSAPNALYSIAGRYGLSIDDRNNPASGGPWSIDSATTRIGDLTINYQNVNTSFPYLDTFSRYQAFAKLGSPVIFFADPAFYSRQYNGGNFPALAFAPGTPNAQFNYDGDAVSLQLSATGNQGQPVVWAASNLPPGLSINQSGQITGTIQPLAYQALPYLTTVTITAGGFSRGKIIAWSVYGGITIDANVPNNLLGHEGMPVTLGPITTTNRYNVPVTLSVSGLPPGLSFDPMTATIGGTIAVGAAQNGPYHVAIHATDGAETANYPFDWPVTGITLAAPPPQISVVGSSVSLTIHATTVSGVPLTYGAAGLPGGLSIAPSTGVISGVIASQPAAEAFEVTITATQGNDVVSTTLRWSVVPSGVSDVITIVNPGTQTNREGEGAYAPIYATSSLSLPISYSIQGLPPGLSLADEGFIGGQIEAGAASASPYHVTITATDGIWSDELMFDWIVESAGTVNVSSPGTQYSRINNSVNLQIFATTTLSQPLTFSAANLPNGLSINPQTGAITGTILPLASLPSVFDVSITVADGTSAYATTFLWNVWGSSFASNEISLPDPDGFGLIDILSPVGTELSASISTSSGVAPPNGVLFPFGFLTFIVSGLAPGAAADVTIVGLDPTDVADYYKYGATPANPTNHWYNFLFGQQTDGDSAVATGMEVVGGNIVLHLIDGGRGDDDLALNGVIYDIGGPAIVQTTVAPADFDSDGDADGADFLAWQRGFGAIGATHAQGDADGDGRVDGDDLALWKTSFSTVAPAPANPGDFNGDGSVGANDLPVWSGAFRASAAGDADSDGDSDGADFLVWQRRLGQQSVVTAAEPIVAAALAGALVSETPRPAERVIPPGPFFAPGIVDSPAARDVALVQSSRAAYRPALHVVNGASLFAPPSAPTLRHDVRQVTRPRLAAVNELPSLLANYRDDVWQDLDLAFASM